MPPTTAAAPTPALAARTPAEPPTAAAAPAANPIPAEPPEAPSKSASTGLAASTIRCEHKNPVPYAFIRNGVFHSYGRAFAIAHTATRRNALAHETQRQQARAAPVQRKTGAALILHACASVAGNQRSERLMAEMMAFSALVVMDESMPTPQMIWASASSPTWHST